MKLILCVFFFIPILCFPQGSNVGIGTTTPDNSSVLDISSNNKGVLVPRLNSQQRMNIPNPADGLLVYDIDNDCFFFYQSTSLSWISLCNSGGIPGPTGPTGAIGATGPSGPTGPTGASSFEIFSLKGQTTTIIDTFPTFTQILGFDTTITLLDTAMVTILTSGDYRHGPYGGPQPIRDYLFRTYINGVPLENSTVYIFNSGTNGEWSNNNTIELLPGTYTIQIKASKKRDNPSSTNVSVVYVCACFAEYNYPPNCEYKHCSLTIQVFYK